MEILSVETLKDIFTIGNPLANQRYLDIQKKELKFLLRKITGELVFSYGLRYHILFEGCIFDKPVVFKIGTKANRSIKFSNCIFNSGLVYEGGEFSGKIIFEDCTFVESSLDFKGGDFKQTVRIERGHFSQLGFYKGNFKEVTVGAFFHETFIDKTFINSSEINGKFDFYRIVGVEFDIRGVLKENSSLFISESIIRNFIVCEFTNNGKLRLKRLTYDFGKLRLRDESGFKSYIKRTENEKKYPYSTFFIQDSVLNNAEFFSIDFSEFIGVFIRESSLINIVTSNIIWPREVLHYPIPENDGVNALRKKSKKDYLLIRENYRQLKFACSKQGDVIGEQHFHGLEMRAYAKSLKWPDNFLDTLILKFSYWTSNFGQSLWRPFIFGFIVIEGFFFWLLYLTGGTKLVSLDLLDFDNQINILAEFIRVINPLHKNDPELTGCSFILDVLLRILSSYFIYNIIRATRRYIK